MEFDLFMATNPGQSMYWLTYGGDHNMMGESCVKIHGI
jgi:hypothetical protein